MEYLTSYLECILFVHYMSCDILFLRTSFTCYVFIINVNELYVKSNFLVSTTILSSIVQSKKHPFLLKRRFYLKSYEIQNTKICMNICLKLSFSVLSLWWYLCHGGCVLNKVGGGFYNILLLGRGEPNLITDYFTIVSIATTFINFFCILHVNDFQYTTFRFFLLS